MNAPAPTHNIDYLVGVVNEVYAYSGISPMNSIALARNKLVTEEGVEDQATLKAVLLASHYADVKALNLRAALELFG